jgi:hypothetical protein
MLYNLTSSKNKVIFSSPDIEFEFDAFENTPKDYLRFLWWADMKGLVKDGIQHHPKEVRKLLHQNFGSKSPYRVGAAFYNTFVRDNIPKEAAFAVYDSGYRYKNLVPHLVNRAVRNNHLVQQAVKDKTLNLLPLMLHMGMDTQQLKQHYGKGLWKRIANTSKTRMKLLAPFLDKNPEWVNVRTALLSRPGPIEGLENLHLCAAKLAPTRKLFEHTFFMIRDTARMANQLGFDINYGWSLKRWQKEHDLAAKETLKQKFCPKPFTEAVNYSVDGYSFTLLNSKLDIATEGSIMHHCVASYADRASESSCHVFRVEGNERATLGVSDNGTSLSFSQCFGRCNSAVSEKLISAARKVVREHDDYLRLRDGRTSGQSHKDSRPELYEEW